MSSTQDHRLAMGAINGGEKPGFVLFDLGGVLVDVVPERAHQKWVDLGYQGELFEDAFLGSGAKEGADCGDHDAEEMRRLVESVAGRPVSMGVLQEVWGAMVAWRPWVGGLMERLTVSYGVLSTIDPVHALALGPLPGADPVIYSCDEGVIKPDPAAFTRAIARCPVSAHRILYLDDRPENVSAAHGAGLNVCRAWSLESVEAALEPVLDAPPVGPRLSPDRKKRLSPPGRPGEPKRSA